MLTPEHFPKYDPALVSELLADIDQSAIHAEEHAKLVSEVWDKKTPINGVSPRHFLERFDVDPNAEIYLVKEAATGRVILFQPHIPKLPGYRRMTPATVHQHREAHHAEIAWSRAHTRIQAMVAAGVTARV